VVLNDGEGLLYSPGISGHRILRLRITNNAMVEEIRELVAKDELAEAVTVLTDLAARANKQAFIDDVTLVAGRIRNFENGLLAAPEDHQQQNIQRTQIGQSILFLLTKYQEILGEPQASEPKETPLRFANFLGPAIILGLAVVAFIWAILVPCPSDSQAFFFRALFALGAAGATGWFMYTAFWRKSPLLGGGIFIALFVCLYLVNPTDLGSNAGCGPFSFSIHLEPADNQDFVYDAQDPGQLLLELDDLKRAGDISEDGTIDFKGIPRKFSGKDLTVTLALPGWQFTKTAANRTQIKLSANYGRLAISPDESRSEVFGRVIDEEGTPIAQVEVSLRAGQIISASDSLGRFRLLIPPRWQAKEHQLTVRHPAYQFWSKTVYPDQQEGLEILLFAKD